MANENDNRYTVGDLVDMINKAETLMSKVTCNDFDQKEVTISADEGRDIRVALYEYIKFLRALKVSE